MIFFYVDVCGIPNRVAAAIVLVAKIWDIINDPMMGAIVDRTKSKEGKCSFWLKRMSVPAIVIVGCCFFIPEISQTGQFVWVAVTYVLQSMVSTTLLIPLNTLLGRLSTDTRQRVHLTQVDGIMQMLSQWMVVSLTMNFVGVFGGGDMRKGFMYVGFIYAVIYGVCHLIVWAATHNYEPKEALAVQEETGTEENLNHTSALKEILLSLTAFAHNKVLLFCGAVAFLYTFGIAIESSAMAFYFQYTKAEAEGLYEIYGTLSMPVAILIYLFLDPIVNHIGKANTAVLGTIMTLAGYVLGFVTGDATTWIMMTRWFLEGLGTGLIGAVILLLIYDSKIYGVWKTGNSDTEAILVASYSLSYKIGMAIGGPAIGFLLDLVPYEPGAAVQPESVNNLFFCESTLIPAIIYVVALIFALLVRKYEKRIPQMQKEIEEREARAAVVK